jgi:hypothetical protein
MTNAERFHVRRGKALVVLQKTGINRRNYLPPIYPLFWSMGILLPPPHFSRFGTNLIVAGSPLGIMGIGFYMMLHDYESASIAALCAVGLGTAALWGGAIATYYSISKRAHRIPSWNSLG